MPCTTTQGAWRVLGLLFWLLYGLRASAQAPGWAALAAYTTTPARFVAAVPDGAGHVLLMGTYTGTLTLGGRSVTSTGSADVFVAKWDEASQQLLWLLSGGGSGIETAGRVAVQGSSVYVVGDYQGPAAFGGTVLPGNASTKPFVAKISDLGTSASWTWALGATATGTLPDRAKAVAVVGSSVYVGGSFASAAVSFGSTTLTNAVSNYNDGFVAKLTDAGTHASWVWAERLGGTLNDDVQALVATGSTVYVGGMFGSSPASFGPTTNLNSQGGYDAYIGKLTDAGTAATWGWTLPLAGTDTEQTNALAWQAGALYATGFFASATLPVGSQTLRNSRSGTADMWVARLADTGPTASCTWALSSGGSGDELGSALAVQGPHLYVAGSYDGAAATFGPGTLASTGQRDIVLAKVLDSGPSAAFAWALTAGGTGNDSPGTVALGTAGVYVGGSVTPPATFGPHSVPGTGSTSAVGCWAYVADVTLATRPAVGPELGLFPNPAHACVVLHLPAAAGSRAASLSLLDATGRPVRNETTTLAPNAREHTLDLRGLAPGLYLLRCTANGSTATQHLVVE